jgi:hypothetical protein
MPVNKNKIVFIASYMKSGNTWMRSILCSLLNNGNFNLDDLKKIKLFSQEVYFSSLEGIKYQENGNIDFDFISKNWINAQKLINNKSNDEIKFFKTHNIRGKINNNYFTDESVCCGFVYLIRDPRDICISLANHMNINIDDSIDIMINQKQFVTNVFKVNESVCTWQEHVESWVNFKSVPRLILRYEDMLSQNENTMDQIVNFLNIIYNNSRKINQETINKTIKRTKFDNLKKMEKISGFVEATNNNFFRKGKTRQWEKILSNKQKSLIENKLGNTMLKLGYL